jgi:hypothetical protein
MTDELPDVLIPATPHRIKLLCTLSGGHMMDVIYIEQQCNKLTSNSKMHIYPSVNIYFRDKYKLQLMLHFDDGTKTEVCCLDTVLLLRIAAEETDPTSQTNVII